MLQLKLIKGNTTITYNNVLEIKNKINNEIYVKTLNNSNLLIKVLKFDRIELKSFY